MRKGETRDRHAAMGMLSCAPFHNLHRKGPRVYGIILRDKWQILTDELQFGSAALLIRLF